MTTFNDRIDSIARKLTDADPPDDLRQRIMARLDERARPPWSWKWAPVMTALVAVGLVALVFIRRPPSPIPDAASPKSGALTAGALMKDAEPGSINVEADMFARARESRGATNETSPRISDVQAEWQARALPALSQPQALTFEGIQPDALAIRPLETQPLVIMPIGAAEDR